MNKELHIRLWLMSCRVLKRGMEDAMMNAVFAQAKKFGLEKVVGYYYPTAKNEIVKDFYEIMGFSVVQEDEVGNTSWELSVDEYETKILHMKVEEIGVG